MLFAFQYWSPQPIQILVFYLWVHAHGLPANILHFQIIFHDAGAKHDHQPQGIQHAFLQVTDALKVLMVINTELNGFNPNIMIPGYYRWSTVSYWYGV